MGSGRHDPSNMGRLSFGGVGPWPFEKTAVPGPQDVAKGVLRLRDFVASHPKLTGAVLGGIIGGLRDPKAENTANDPHANMRSRLGSMFGGAAGGALVGESAERYKGRPNLGPLLFQQTASLGRGGMNAGKAVADVFAPGPKIPDSLTGLLGNKKRYTEGDVQHKYQQEFGNSTPSPEHEAKFISALRDIYSTETTKDRTAPSKKELLKQQAPAFGTLALTAAPALMGFNTRPILMSLLPSLVQQGAVAAKSIKHHHVDPGVSVDPHDARARAQFSDDQLRNLLRGLGVEEVKEHVIK